jgi:hypothetical protein
MLRKPCLGRWFMSACHEKIANFEDQSPRSFVANCDLLAGTKTIKDWNSNSKQRNLKTLRCLPSVRMSDEQISSNRSKFEIFQVAHKTSSIGIDSSTGDAAVVTASLNLASHFMKPVRYRE